MGVLTKDLIIERLNKNELLINARRTPTGEYDVEHSSYDLSAGIAVIKHDGIKIFSKRTKKYKYIPDSFQKNTVTLKPGQMMFVVTHEEINMPSDLCGTVYSRNSLAQKGILALNAGHVDPGFRGPITIKLISLRNSNYTFQLGEAIFTLVFTKLESAIPDLVGQTIMVDDTVKRVLAATDLSLDNALYDLALLNNFIKKDEFGKQLFKWLRSSVAGIFTLILTFLGAAVTIAKVSDLLGVTSMIKSLLQLK
jgi:deoxycytidine triphosphate deaminase